jgi:DNA-binding CsgD family transcriptional regulator
MVPRIHPGGLLVSEGPYLGEDDVRAIVRLLGEVAAIDGDVRIMRKALAEGVCKLVNASVYIWINAASHNGGRPMPYAFIDGGWHDLAARDGMMAISQDPSVPDPGYDMLRKSLTHITIDRAEYVGAELEKTYKQLLQPFGLDEELATFYPLGKPGLFSMILLFRRAGQPPFTARDRMIFHLITSEVDWLHRDGVPADDGKSVATLSPRQRQVLLLLLSGYAAKEIAPRLQLSTHTVNDHIRDLYRHFDVTSRAELLAMFLSGGVRPPHGGKSLDRRLPGNE